ncbi:fibroblast growth factor binding protein 2a [Lampris incognitus]|uniref:fibroblast growth factor binding protein 2a n=1 Tax=Lampris incognitus TaxID=2546036 RepID=UPI0024B55A09|nr:fibroblast growth factor binding protein 2a [Lampris incognitus]
MWVHISAVLLLVCCLQAVEAQADGRRRSIWEDPIRFISRDRDQCTMMVTGQAQLTMLRVLCRSTETPGDMYWCDYVGQPHTCRPYNSNPRHFFTQIMWNLRKLYNACDAPPVLVAHMCRKGPTDAHMHLSASSSVHPGTGTTREATSRQPGPKPASRSTRPAQPRTKTPATPARADHTKLEHVRRAHLKSTTEEPEWTTSGTIRPAVESTTPREMTTAETSAPQLTTSTSKSYAKRKAQEVCWRSFQGICSYFIGLFKN